MTGTAVYVRLVALPGRRDDLVAALRPFLESAEKEPGTLAYSAHHDAEDADAIWFYTVFADLEALETHRRNEAELAVTYPEVPQLLAGPASEVQGELLNGRWS